MFSKSILASITMLTAVSCTPSTTNSYEKQSETQVAAAETRIAKVAAALEQTRLSKHRSEFSRQRDVYRHPVETLSFFGFEPGMTVVEISPGGGWYTEILAPAVGDKGVLYAAHFDAQAERAYYQKSLAAYKEKLAANPELYANVVLTEFAVPAKLDVAPPGSADLVLTFRNVHNWMRTGRADAVAGVKAMHKALKPGGIMGVVEHRMPAGRDYKLDDKSGYMPEQFVIELFEEAGFELVATSEINANPKDTADHPAGVWTLPPSMRLKDADREKYLAIGESDRMTLKFRKPE